MLSGVSGSSGGGKKKLDSGFLQMYVNLCESNPGMVKNPEDSVSLNFFLLYIEGKFCRQIDWNIFEF